MSHKLKIVRRRQMKLMHNGILEVDHVRPVEVTQLDDYLPSSWFGPFTENNGTVRYVSQSTNLRHIILVWFDCHEEAQSLRLHYGKLH